LAAEAHALIANHLIPIGGTRRRDPHVIEWIFESSHDFFLSRRD
jgi:hypothetical protein